VLLTSVTPLMILLVQSLTFTVTVMVAPLLSNRLHEFNAHVTQQ